MRDIKFRGKSSCTGKWVYSSIFESFEDGEICLGIREGNMSDMYNIQKETFGQYTGLKDKNEKEIYEGDIVKGVAIADEGSFDYLGQVIWYTFNHVIGWYIEDYNGGGWKIKQVRTKISTDHITGEVIGNIHDHPELLKENQ